MPPPRTFSIVFTPIRPVGRSAKRIRTTKKIERSRMSELIIVAPCSIKPINNPAKRIPSEFSSPPASATANALMVIRAPISAKANVVGAIKMPPRPARPEDRA